MSAMRKASWGRFGDEDVAFVVHGGVEGQVGLR